MFCSTHNRAPAAQRGGWLSAARRRQAMGRIDATNIHTRLWVGSEPPFDHDLPDFDLLVLCAREIQPEPEKIAFRRTVFRCPLPDAQLNIQELTAAVLVGKAVGDALMGGRRALVTCAKGLNRSAFISALALARITKMSAEQIVTLVRTRRGPSAMSNPYFCQVLRSIVRR